ncbi:MAG: hypothetical protein AB7K09_10295 [Planctomycetota bacterium]
MMKDLPTLTAILLCREAHQRPGGMGYDLLGVVNQVVFERSIADEGEGFRTLFMFVRLSGIPSPCRMDAEFVLSVPGGRGGFGQTERNTGTIPWPIDCKGEGLTTINAAIPMTVPAVAGTYEVSVVVSGHIIGGTSFLVQAPPLPDE